MDALTLLHTRNSAPKLKEPAPEGDVLEDIFQAALRAPDHARLRPWRFLTIAGNARDQLGKLFVDVEQQHRQQQGKEAMTAEEIDKMLAKPLRAPLIIVAVASIKEHPKVPEIEQIISTGCAAHSILLAAQAQGYAGIWRTGGVAYDSLVKQGLGLADNEQVVGFLYIGTIQGAFKPLPEMGKADFCQSWPDSQ